MKILLALDGSGCSEAALAEVAERPWPADTQVRVVSVVEPAAPLMAEPYVVAGGYFEEVERIKRQQADDVVGRARLRLSAATTTPLQVSVEVLPGSPRRVIVEEAEKWGADLIVMGSHGYRTWERMLLGSVSQTVAAHAPCSVQIVHCKKAVTSDE
ncbi:MAG TPA: universal stress protein [Pyrinomonadaceae bacterium]